MKINPDKILSVEALKIGFQRRNEKYDLLPPLNACAHNGDLIAVIGRNGIGKSTLLRTIAGLQPALGGNILFNGKSISDYSRLQLAKEVGYISTEVVKVSNMTVYDLVSLGRYPHTNWIGKIDSYNHEKITDALESTSVSCFSNRFISELSDGERQRAMIARLLAQDTGIMVMDEPTAFLDTGSKYEILHLLGQLAHKKEKTIIYSTHDLQMAIRQSDKIWLILDDKLIEGAPEDLILAGVFDHLFDKSHVLFNSDDNSFSFINIERGYICLEGEGVEKKVLEKALSRAGYSISNKGPFPKIKITGTKNYDYYHSDSDPIRNFGSIYDLVRFLDMEG